MEPRVHTYSIYHYVPDQDNPGLDVVVSYPVVAPSKEDAIRQALFVYGTEPHKMWEVLRVDDGTEQGEEPDMEDILSNYLH